MSSRPPRIPAASLERKGFQTRYSIFVGAGASVAPFDRAGEEDSTLMRFSP